MRLGEKQELFAELMAHLLHHAFILGYTVRIGHVFRSKEEAERLGFPRSLHTKKLAVDLNLFKDGKFLRKTSDHAELGAFWKSLHPLCCWGGDFTRPDGNHYSVTHNGVK